MRDRLTYRDENGKATRAPMSHAFQVLEKLARYEDAEDQGRLIVLPCKVGDTVYTLDCDEHGEPADYTGHICIGGNTGYLVLSSLYNDVEDADSLCYANYIELAENEMLASEIFIWPVSQCYFTREEAEAAMERGSTDGN